MTQLLSHEYLVKLNQFQEDKPLNRLKNHAKYRTNFSVIVKNSPNIPQIQKNAKFPLNPCSVWFRVIPLHSGFASKYPASSHLLQADNLNYRPCSILKAADSISNSNGAAS
jgi:hypothetical protein